MIPYQWTSASIAIVIAAVIVWLVRNNYIHARSATWWVLLAFAIAAVGTFPQVVDWIAVKLGISYPPILAVLAGLAVALVKMLQMDIERSKERQQLRILAQKITVLEARLYEKENENAHEKK